MIPRFGLGPGSALGLLPSMALSSTQVVGNGNGGSRGKERTSNDPLIPETTTTLSVRALPLNRA